MRMTEIEALLTHDLGVNTYKAALRECIWFSYGYHLARVSGCIQAEQYLDDVRAFILGRGGYKSEASQRVKTTRLVGPRIPKMFPTIAGISHEDHTNIVNKMFEAALDRGAVSVVKLVAWAETTGEDRH